MYENIYCAAAIVILLLVVFSMWRRNTSKCGLNKSRFNTSRENMSNLALRMNGGGAPLTDSLSGVAEMNTA
jgi:hypothetical protein